MTCTCGFLEDLNQIRHAADCPGRTVLPPHALCSPVRGIGRQCPECSFFGGSYAVCETQEII
jgi:hypothetical protein